jgi:hypothetical protein
MDPKRKRILLICVAVFIGSYIVRSLVFSVMQMAYYRQQAIRAAQLRMAPKPKPVAPAPPVSSPSVKPPVAPEAKAAPPLPSVAARMFSGIWSGRAVLPGRGICALHLEIKPESDKPDHFSGYSSLICDGMLAVTSPQRAQLQNRVTNDYDPEAAVLEGTVENGAIHFKPTQIVGKDTGGCAPSSLVVAGFGAFQIAATWEEPTCSGGHLLMRRVRR